MRLEFSLAAETDLDRVFADGVAKFGMPAADDYLKALTQSLWRLLDFPRSNPILSEIGSAIRIHKFRSRIILYRLAGPKLIVLRVQHMREDWEQASSGPRPVTESVASVFQVPTGSPL